MSGTRSRGVRLRLALASAMAAALTTALGASSAVADVITFDHGAVKVAGAGNAIPIVTPADPLEINNVTYGPGNAFASSTADDFDFSAYSGSAGGVDFTIDIVPLAPVTGSFDPATGVMTTDPIDYRTTVGVAEPPGTSCVYTTEFAFSTESTKVIFGDRFDAMAPPPVNGAVVGSWAGVPGDPQLGCGPIDQQARRPGAFWFSNGIETPTLVPVPGFKCKKGQKKSRGKKGKKCVCKKPGRKLKKGKCVKKKPKGTPGRRR